MIDYINISTLNDFIFCPYSIYLHNVYMETDETMYHATPQTRGKIAHGADDSVIIFDVSGVRLRKYGNALHRDVDVVYL